MTAMNFLLTGVFVSCNSMAAMSTFAPSLHTPFSCGADVHNIEMTATTLWALQSNLLLLGVHSFGHRLAF